MKSHLKRLAIPKSWPVKRRGIVFVAKPSPGPHPIKMGIPLKLVIREMLGIAKNSGEAGIILNRSEVFVDGVRRKEPKFPVGVMDIIEIKKSNEHFRVVVEKGKLSLLPVDKKEAGLKPCRITGKNLVKGKVQLNLYDGRNIIVEKGGKDGYKVGDTLIIALPGGEIKEHIKLEKGCFVYLIGGKRIGDIGRIEDIISGKVVYKGKNGERVETLKKYVFVIGKDKPAISLTRKE